MNSTIKNIAVITNIAPHYRSILWEKLLKNRSYHFEFYFGNDVYQGIEKINFKTERFASIQNQIHHIRNVYFKSKLLFWQKGILRKCIVKKIDAAIILGDSYIISNWIAAIIFRIRGIQVIFWSHGLYGNEGWFKKRYRTLFYKLANEHLLYERRAKGLMVSSGFNANKLHIIFNSLDYEATLLFRTTYKDKIKKQTFSFFNNPELPTILFIGRLTKVKKLDYLVEAIHLLKSQQYNVNLLIIGEGDQKETLKLQMQSLNVMDQCYLYGACYSEEVLAKLISTADLCVSPGNVGLTAIHSMSYGTPVLTHDNFQRQMPEVGAITEGKNGCFFKENDLSSMVDHIKDWLFSNKLTRNEIRENCYGVIDKYYNPNYQVRVIENLLKNQPPLI